MSSKILHLLLLFKRLLLLVLLYALLRGIFFAFNAEHFSGISFWELCMVFFFGLRFDIAAIVLTNTLLIILHLVPHSRFHSRAYQRFLKILFWLFNIPAVAFNCVDWVFFKFTLKRTTGDIFSMLGLGDDFFTILPQLLIDYLHVTLLFTTLVVLTEFLYRRISFVKFADKQHLTVRKQTVFAMTGNILLHVFLFVIITGLCLVGARGGFQLRPVNIVNAAESVKPQYAPLVLNTSFTILKTLAKSELKETNYFTDNEKNKLFSIQHHYSKTETFQKLNVVVIILESFSKEYIGSLSGYASYTPFLDSLIKESLVFSNAYSNGKRSIEGIPSVVAGLPSLMNNPYITSSYSGNRINSLASILKEKGYNTSFYHGGTNGTMGFDGFSRMSGFDTYYGRFEYNNEKNFDDNWGIYDDEYLLYFAKQLDKTPEPFLSCIFTLSSHHPYFIPEKFRGKFSKGTLPIHESIMYTDFALRQFFQAASKMPWYDSTLFVITADHTGAAEHPFYQTRTGMYAVPIIFYRHNSTLKGVSNIITQQTDILPSVLDYLNYTGKFTAFGKSVFDTAQRHFAISFLNNTYQLVENNYSLIFADTNSIALYHLTTDSLQTINLLGKEIQIQNEMEKKIKAVIQTYNYGMVHNRLTGK